MTGLKIAYLGAFYKRARETGGNIHIKKFMDEVVSAGHEVYAWGCDEHPKTHKIPNSRAGRILALRGMDVLYYRLETSLPVDSRWMVPPRSWLLKKPTVVWEFNAVPEIELFFGEDRASVCKKTNELKRFAPACDLAICVSDKIRAYASSKLGIGKAISIPNGSDPDLFRPADRMVEANASAGGDFNVAMIGSLDAPWHNIELFGKAAFILNRDGNAPSVVFHLFGAHPSPSIRMPENVRFHGYIPYRDLPLRLAPMDVGLCLHHPGPADYFSPLKVFDYMSCELAVVGTMHPQLASIFRKLGQTDFLVSHDDPEALACLLRTLANNRELVARQGRAGRRLVVSEYNWKKIMEKTIAAIETIIRSRGRRKK